MKTLADVIEEMFMYYIRSELYTDLSEEARNKFADQVEELKQLASSEK